MLNLELHRAPYWLDLACDVRVRMLPVSTSMLEAIQRRRGEVAAETAGDRDAAGPSMLEICREFARHGIVAWEGVEEDLTPERAVQLMEVFPVYEAFRDRYALPALDILAEGNASAPLPNGTSAGARSTAPAARKSAKTARKSKKRP